MSSQRDLDLFRLAALRQGAISVTELRSIGLDSAAVRRRVQGGMLQPFYRGVYLVPSLRGPDQRLHAATLAMPNGALARSTAAARLGLPMTPNGIRLVVPHGMARRIRGIVVHETRSLPPEHIVIRDGLAVTSGARTLCDLAPFMRKGRLQHPVELALTQGITSVEDLVAVVSERRGERVRGMREFALLLATLLDDEPYPESMFEVDLMKGFAEVGLMGMSRQYRPSWYDGIRGTVDFHDSFGSASIVEADGRGFRQVTQAHNNDRQRDRLAVGHGAVVIRVGHREFKQRRMGILLEVKEIIERRRISKAA